MTANNNMTANTPVIECKGKLMLASQYRAQTSKSMQRNNPYVAYYQLSESLEIVLDGKTYGNDSRFCRRSADYNAELKHVIDKGSLHLFIITNRIVTKNQEILLPPDTGSGGSRSGPGSPQQQLPPVENKPRRTPCERQLPNNNR